MEESSPPDPGGNAESYVRDLVFSPTGEHLLAGTMNGKLIKLNIQAPTAAPLVVTNNGPIFDVKVSADQQRILMLTKDSTIVSLRQFEPGSPVAELQHDVPVAAVALSPKGKVVATADRSGTVKIWELASGALKYQYSCGQSDNQVVRLQFVDGDRLLTYRQAVQNNEQCQIICWKLGEQSSEQLFEFTTDVSRLFVDLPSDTLLVSRRSGPCLLLSLQSGTVREEKLATNSPVIAAYFFHSSAQVATVELDGSLTTWSIKGQRQRYTKHTSGVVAAAVDNDRKFVAIAGSDGLISVYWLHLLKKVGTDLVADEAVSTVAFHPDGRRVAAGGSLGWCVFGTWRDWLPIFHCYNMPAQ